MNNYKLYLHTVPNGKRYYGITMQEPEKRWANGKGYKNNQYFTNAINKYGWDNIKHEILFDDLTESEAKELEQYFIQWYDSANRKCGYNITLGGEGASGYHHTEEAKQKIGEAQKGKTHTEETRQKLSVINKGKIHTEETKQKISKAKKGANNPNYGKHRTEETKRKISEANKGRCFTEEHRKNLSEAQKGKNHSRAKSVICITTCKIFFTTTEAARYYGVAAPSHISSCCKGKSKSAGKSPDGKKLVWKYLNYKHDKIYRIEELYGEKEDDN